MTVGLSWEGTITVVVFCGAGGLLLLMQPASSNDAATKRAETIFILNAPLGAARRNRLDTAY